MQSVRVLGLALVLATGGQVQAVSAQAACAADPTKLGVSRTVTIDAAAGPHFGAQYRDTGLLADGEVVLTFDDGPSRAYTRPILHALAAQCTKATFFMVGRMALADPAMVREVAAEGHTVATHTWSHANLHLIGARSGEAEIELGISAVGHALGRPVAPFFRFPYLRDTNTTLRHLADRHIAAFSIDVDSKDYLTTSATAVVARVLGELARRRKGIILMHDIHASTARALPVLLAELKARRFKVVHVRPKSAVQTLAEYDAQALQQAERKTASARRSLQRRAVTWPATVLGQNPAHASIPPRPAPQPRPEDDWMARLWRW